MVEYSLHEDIKLWYSRDGDRLEQKVEGYVVDIVRKNLFIEIQTSNFSSIKEKLRDLVRSNVVMLVHPISIIKWIVRVTRNGKKVISQRKSPRKGRIEDLFSELVYIPKLLQEQNFSVDVLLVYSKEILVNDGRGSWRRKGWSIIDRRLIKVVDHAIFSKPTDFLSLLPMDLPSKFTTYDISKFSNLRLRLAQQMVYCLRQMDLIKKVGKRNRANLYEIN